MGKPDCKKCMFRAYPWYPYQCEYAGITGRTRKAQEPEKCTYFKEGKRMEKQEYRLMEELRKLKQTGRKRAPGAGPKEKYDWAFAMQLHRLHMNDGQIGRALGCSPMTVRDWRKRNNLPANTTAGGRRKA